MRITISGNYESLTPVLADKQLAGYMNVPEQTPLLRITSLSYSDSGEFLNYSVMFRNTSDYRWTTICGVSTRKTC